MRKSFFEKLPFGTGYRATSAHNQYSWYQFRESTHFHTMLCREGDELNCGDRCSWKFLKDWFIRKLENFSRRHFFWKFSRKFSKIRNIFDANILGFWMKKWNFWNRKIPPFLKKKRQTFSKKCFREKFSNFLMNKYVLGWSKKNSAHRWRLISKIEKFGQTRCAKVFPKKCKKVVCRIHTSYSSAYQFREPAHIRNSRFT